ncbi:hypothetical protein M9991_12290 [Chryseobacterium gallinarum]|uniref:BfmA/BtgA family mobilization protein n=1 Tax=Chryseobacterium gallinarum TaxID=1324352 RepID=UPI002024D9F8|nr:BfmA/BtgA family mobilization protein [Chryseobacterium gallinarum]MCL8537643.1 hypothetical protein [Chryseobacterium gallinarum]
MMKQTDTNSIRYPQEVDEKIAKLAKNFRRSKKELFCQMVDYFYRCKKDPADPGDEVLKKELSMGISRIISFIRQQEKDFLLPMFTDSTYFKTTALKQKELLEGIGKHLLTETERTLSIIERTDRLLAGMKIIASRQAEKDILKQRFSELLEYYIAQREEMNWTTNAQKKEELAEHIRKSLKNL